jgi:ABC-type Fe3+/spermidine/putrescine transport system ATPase subunit
MTARAAVDGLGFRYAGAGDWALRGVTLSLAAGEVLAVVGPSGSGKSTLLRLLTGLARPAEGAVRIDGADVTHVAPERRPVAMVFQGFALLPHLTVRDNVAFGPRVRREPRAAVAARVAEVTDALGIGRLLDRFPAQLSGGERQRVALARALVRDPVLFCLDEPLSSLDPQLRTDARRLLAPLLRAEGRCAVYVTHDQEEALSMSDTIAVMNAGRIEQIGSPEEIYLRPRTRFVAGFLGAVNWIGEVGVRPEALRLAREAPANGDRRLPCAVVRSLFLGNCFQVQVRLDGGADAIAEIPRSEQPFDPGEAVWACWRDSDEMRFEGPG